MKRLIPLAVPIMIASATAAAQGEEPPADADADDDPEYGEAGSYELGGTITASWTSDVIDVSGGPTFGVFVWDRIELSATLTFNYTRTEVEDTDDHVTTKSGTFVIEPSYHYPISETRQVLAGLGVGTGWDGDHWDFELIPRIGINFITARSNVITPSIKFPFLIGEAHGSNGDVGTSFGIVFEIGITTTW